MTSPASQPTPVRVPSDDGSDDVSWAPPVADQRILETAVEWDDGTVVSSTWNRPSRWDGWSRRTRLLTVLALLLAVAVTLWQTGAYQQTNSLFTTVPNTQPMRTGPYEVRFVQAIFDKSTTGWSVKVLATCQNVSGEGQDFDTVTLNQAFLAAVNTPDGETVLASRTFASLGEWDRFGTTRNDLPPGLAPIACQFTGDLPAELVPPSVLLVGMFDLEWTPEAFGRNEGWNTAFTGQRTQIPVVVKPVPPS